MATDSLMIMSRLDEQWKEIRPSDVDVSEKFAEIKLPAGRLPSHFAIVDRGGDDNSGGAGELATVVAYECVESAYYEEANGNAWEWRWD